MSGGSILTTSYICKTNKSAGISSQLQARENLHWAESQGEDTIIKGFIKYPLGDQPYNHGPPFQSGPCYFPSCMGGAGVLAQRMGSTTASLLQALPKERGTKIH